MFYDKRVQFLERSQKCIAESNIFDINFSFKIQGQFFSCSKKLSLKANKFQAFFPVAYC